MQCSNLFIFFSHNYPDDCELYSAAKRRELQASRIADMHHGMDVCLGISKGPAQPSFL
jgi:hypothetical protein